MTKAGERLKRRWINQKKEDDGEKVKRKSSRRRMMEQLKKEEGGIRRNARGLEEGRGNEYVSSEGVVRRRVAGRQL